MDPQQEILLNEKCILVDDNDKIMGEATKKDCHLVRPNGDILLHRAFSVFLFNKKGDLLIQKRAATKITYPNKYTNTCCSHPLSEISQECIEENATGVKLAALRRLNYELGIPLEDLSLKDLNHIAKIYYKDQGDGIFGEHEVDYIIFVQKDVKLDPNLNEVSEVKYVSKKNFEAFLNDVEGQITPWFELILTHLRFWWDNLKDLDQIKNCDDILRLKF